VGRGTFEAAGAASATATGPTASRAAVADPHRIRSMVGFIMAPIRTLTAGNEKLVKLRVF
jgi:hypothetical protein